MKPILAASQIILLTLIANITAFTLFDGLRRLRQLQPLSTVGWNN